MLINSEEGEEEEGEESEVEETKPKNKKQKKLFDAIRTYLWYPVSKKGNEYIRVKSKK